MSRKRNMPRRSLPLGKRIEAARTLDVLDRSRAERGLNNESFAQKICQNFVAKGLIEYLWAIPQHSGLDHRGIDIVCQTPKGYYFLNVKSSAAGVDSFHAKRVLLKRPLLDIFPWLVVRYRGEAEAGRQLERILGHMPSCDILPQEVLEGLVGLTPNTVLVNAVIAGKREQRLKKAVENERTARISRAKLLEKKRALETILFANYRSWRSKFEDLESKKICSIKKWSITRNAAEWAGEIEILVLDNFIARGQAVSTTRKGAESLAAEMAAREISIKVIYNE